MSKKKILVFAHYYVPDTASTGQILQDLAEGLLKEFEVTVICVVPSYGGVIDSSYKTQKYYSEQLNGVKIIRVAVPEFNKEVKSSRIKNILAYFFRAIKAARKSGKQDYIFTISQPPVLGGLLGVVGKFFKHAKLIYCIQDFNPEQISAVSYSNNKFVLRTMMFLDKFSCRRSDLVITVGRDLGETLKNRFNNKKVPSYSIINNWINENEVYPVDRNNENVVSFKDKYDLTDKYVVMYSGNIGLYYDLENLLKTIEHFKPGTTSADGREVVFAFVGEGTLLNDLMNYSDSHGMTNVKFIPYQKKEDLIYSLNSADVHWCVNAKGIKGVSCPSKFYGIAAVGKPVLAVLESGSEIRMIIEETECGLLSDPGDYETVQQNIQWFIDNAGSALPKQMGENGYVYLKNNLTKDVSIDKYIKSIQNL